MRKRTSFARRSVRANAGLDRLAGICLKRSWGGEVKNIAVLVAVGVRTDGHREILGVAEGTKEDSESWRTFLRHLKERGLRGVRLIVSDKCLGLVEALGEFFPEAAWQRCIVHFYRNVLKDVPRGKSRDVAAMLKAVHAQEDRPRRKRKRSSSRRNSIRFAWVLPPNASVRAWESRWFT